MAKAPVFDQKHWDVINTVIREDGGAIISPPGNRIRFIASHDSALPEVLRYGGHAVIPVGCEQRLGPVIERIPTSGGQFTTRSHMAEVTVAVYELDIAIIDNEIAS